MTKLKLSTCALVRPSFAKMRRNGRSLFKKKRCMSEYCDCSCAGEEMSSLALTDGVEAERGLLCGLSLSSVATFRTVNSVMGIVTEVSTGTSTTGPTSLKESVDFTMDGTAVKTEIDAVQVPIIYQSTPSGQQQDLVYAATTDTNNNTYRNVLLRMEVPVLQSLGTLVYRLKEAAFTTK